VGQPLADEPYHYRASGLDSGYLLNGFTREDTGYGPGVTIQDMDGLHPTIARDIATSTLPVSARDVRFLRKMMDLTQEHLAHLLGIDAQTVARYEKEQSAISGPVDRLRHLIHLTFELLPGDRTDGLVAVVDRLVSGPPPSSTVPHGWAHVEE
jgi:DNA-binding transcriptional regulator YiaG